MSLPDEKGYRMAHAVWAVEATLRVFIAACSTQSNASEHALLSHMENALPMLADRLGEIGGELDDENWKRRGEVDQSQNGNDSIATSAPKKARR